MNSPVAARNELDAEFTFWKSAPVDASTQRNRVPAQARAVKTRASLVSAAARAFGEDGYAGATAKGIAEVAGAATGSFYQYFTSKDEVLRELAAGRQEVLVERALGLLEVAGEGGAAEVRARLRAVIDAVVAYHAADRGLHAVITERRHVDRELDALIAAGERRLIDRIAALLGRWGHVGDATPTAFVLLATLEGAVHAHVLGHPVVDDRRFVDALAEALLRIALPTPTPAQEMSWPSSR